MFKNILVPVDGSDQSMDALEAACSLASQYHAKLTVLHVLEDAGSARIPPELQSLARIEHIQVTERDMMNGIATEIIARARARAYELGVEHVLDLVETGNPGQAIAHAAEQHEVDLIVMGRRGLGKVANLLMGSVSNRVMQLAKCACLTVT